jgi:hypothetical protein
MTKQISIDLDWTLFDLQPLYEMAFRYGMKYYPPEYEDVHQAYKYIHANQISSLLGTNQINYMPVMHNGIPNVISKVWDTDIYSIYYVSDRVVRNQKKSYEQLRRAGIKCNITDVYDYNIPKIEMLQDLIETQLHFDDSPSVIENCVRRGINCVMISGPKTPFNHYLRNQIKWYPDIVCALKSECLSNSR